MKNTMTAAAPSIVKACALGVALSVSALSAYAAPTPYGDAGNENLVEYNFTATASGDVVAYFVGKGGAEYTNSLRVYINGVDTGISGLANQTSSYGESLNFGSVNAGDSVVFAIDVENTGKTWYSDKSQNVDGVNHVFASSYEGDEFIPVGTYIAFEDLNGFDGFPSIDFNYLDEQFVVTNLSRERSTPEVPVPAAAWLFGSSLIGLAGVARRRAK
jgi:hypothetical protein